MIRTLTFEYFATGEGYHVDVFISDALDIEKAYFEKKNITDEDTKKWYSLGFEIFEGINNVNNYVNNLPELTKNSNVSLLFSYSCNNS